MSKEKFIEGIQKGYKFEGDSLMLGGAMFDRECQHEIFVRLPLKTLNRHGLIAGATGTGKTKSLQILAEQQHRPAQQPLLLVLALTFALM